MNVIEHALKKKISLKKQQQEKSGERGGVMCAPKISLIFVIDLGLYVSLITLPGSGPYKIFHPVIYSKALQTLQIIKKIPALHGLPRRYLKLYTSVLN